MTPTKNESPRAATPGDSEPTLTKKIGDSIMAQAACKHCTVDATGPDQLCNFCRDYVPPPSEADQLVADLAAAHTAAGRGADRLEAAIAEIPGTVPLWAVVDVVAAKAHMAAARRLIDRAAVTITAAEAVGR